MNSERWSLRHTKCSQARAEACSRVAALVSRAEGVAQDAHGTSCCERAARLGSCCEGGGGGGTGPSNEIRLLSYLWKADIATVQHCTA